MLHTHLKHGLRLNRTLSFSLLAYVLLLLTSLSVPSDALLANQTWAYLRLGAMAMATVVFMFITEACLRTLKRHPKMDEINLEKISILLLLLGGGIIAACYLLSGQLGIFLLSTIILLQAQLFGHMGMSRVFLLLFFLIYLVTLPLGYPLLLGFTPEAFKPLTVSLKIIMMLVPVIAMLGHYGNIVATLIRSNSTRVSKLQSLAATDALTGLINRRQFNHQLDSEIARTKRYRNPLSLALFDIDDFKRINDLYGHITGDRILKELGHLILTNVRESDIAARYGGEEFALILPETGQIDSYELLERLRAMIEHTVFCLPDNPMTVTISVGVAQMDVNYTQGFEIIEKADAALYEAKRKGKNQVVYGALTFPKASCPPFRS